MNLRRPMRVTGADEGRARYLASAALCLYALAPAGAAFAATRAGASIANIATLSWSDNGQPRSVPSNTVSLTAAEVLDVTIAAERAQMAVAPGAIVAVGFVVTNTGNGAEDFALTVASDQANVAITRIAVDTDNDGVYDASRDQAIAAGAALTLAPGQQTRIFVIVDGAQVTTTTRISAAVAATTGSGAPGTVFAGAGDGGGDAVVGGTGAAAGAATLLTPATGQPGLVKSQSVVSPDGNGRAVRGAIVTYRLVASFPTATRGVAVDDPIPAGTDYVAGSLSLDDQPLSDARDTDAGTIDPAGIHVALGDAAAASTRIIQFSVKIQ
ncbi:hypothetical protein [uncultured Sphingomonas sp.]|uniref:hypothetical protein n=1 Tax=uncultured Sphingomonas sp. TaxID=158754 RepID=UPI0035CC2785